MAFIVMLLVWGVALATTLDHALQDIMREAGLTDEAQHLIGRRFQLISTGLAMAAMAAVLVFMLAVIRRILRPLREITEAARRVSAGDYSARAEERSDDESGVLARAFNAMVAAVRESTETLERRVEERTAQLERANLLLSEEIRLSREYAIQVETLNRFHRTVLDSMHDGVAILDAGTLEILSVNAALLRETGRSEKELLGRTCSDVLHAGSGACEPPDRACPAREMLTSGKHTVAEHVHRGGADGLRYVEVSASPVVDDRGAIARIVYVTRDITERKKIENDLHRARGEAEERHRELEGLFRKVETAKEEWERTMDCINDIVVLAAENGAVIRCNNALKRFAGVDYAEILGKNWEDVVIGERLNTDWSAAGELEIHHGKTGQWFTINSYPFRDRRTDRMRGHVITVRDTSALKGLTESLELTNTAIDRERAELKEALEQMSGLIQRVMDSGDLSIRYPNPRLWKCYETMACEEVSCPCYGKEALRCWQTAGTFCKQQTTGRFVDKFEACTSCPVYGAATNDTVHQISEHFNNMMHMLEDKNRELQNAYSELKSAQSQILQQEKMASIGQLAAGVAHEINNPVGFVMSNLGTLRKYVGKLVEFLKAQADTAAGCASAATEGLDRLRRELKIDYVITDADQLIRESLEGTERVKKIVQDLKGFSRIDEAKWKSADINSGIESTLNIVWNELKYKAVVKKEYGDLPQTLCNLSQLNQVFMNLLVNAAHAIDKQGEIAIRTWSDGKNIFASIADTGCGMPQEILPRIFEPFFTTKEVGKGTGLGLSIAYDIVKKHRGDISVESTQGVGTVFTVRIPVATEAAGEPGGR